METHWIYHKHQRYTRDHHSQRHHSHRQSQTYSRAHTHKRYQRTQKHHSHTHSSKYSREHAHKRHQRTQRHRHGRHYYESYQQRNTAPNTNNPQIIHQKQSRSQTLLYGVLFKKKNQSLILNVIDQLDSITFNKIYAKFKTKKEYGEISKQLNGNEQTVQTSLKKLLMHFMNRRKSGILAENQHIQLHQNLPMETGSKYEKYKQKWNQRFRPPQIQKTDKIQKNIIKKKDIITIDIEENNNNNRKSMAYFMHSKRMFIC